MRCLLLQSKTVKTWACRQTNVSSKAPIIRRLLQTSASHFDPYKTLGVSRFASQNEIKGAFYQLSKAHHPDQNPGCAKSAELFKTISSAYGVIRSFEKRRDYERKNNFRTGVPRDAMPEKQGHAKAQNRFRRNSFNEREYPRQNHQHRQFEQWTQDLRQREAEKCRGHRKAAYNRPQWYREYFESGWRDQFELLILVTLSIILISY